MYLQIHTFGLVEKGVDFYSFIDENIRSDGKL